jgi:hypothetical protein
MSSASTMKTLSPLGQANGSRDGGGKSLVASEIFVKDF